VKNKAQFISLQMMNCNHYANIAGNSFNSFFYNIYTFSLIFAL